MVAVFGGFKVDLEFFLNGVKEISAQATQSAHQILTLFECVWQVELAHFGRLIWPTLSC